jgi:uncharacterized surface protein with fasciclin (FAS1) repeats
MAQPHAQQTPPTQRRPEPRQSPPTGQSNRSNILDILQANTPFSTLTQAIQAAGLTNTLSKGTYTVFAPTDEAFQALPQGALEFLTKPENKNLLRQILRYHVVPGNLTSKKLKSGRLKTLGGDVTVRVTSQGVTINDASLLQADIPAKNGVIHAVNRVILTPQLRRTLESKLGTSQPTPGRTP